jgi:O-acetyl-ADP-ribose deacetylase (regulator of RNase III)
MTKIIHKTGDIFTTKAQAMGHGVNIDGIMGHGIAVQFRNCFPDMYAAYKALCGTKKLAPGEAMVWDVPAPKGVLWETQYVYNIASQDRPGRNARLDWLRDGVIASLYHARDNGVKTLALPRIGSGIGGLDQNEVEAVLLELAESGPTDIEIWTYDR